MHRFENLKSYWLTQLADSFYDQDGRPPQSWQLHKFDGESADFDWFFSLSNMLELLTYGNLLPPQIACVRNLQSLDATATYLREVDYGGHALTALDPKALGTLFDEGCTFIINRLERLNHAVSVARRSLQWSFGAQVSANAYLTTSETPGIAPHWDDHDVLVLQVAGTKVWRVGDKHEEAPLYREDQPIKAGMTDSFDTIELEVGDVLYVSRGCWHETRALCDASLHVTFSINRLTGMDLLGFAAYESRKLAIFRRDLNLTSIQEYKEEFSKTLSSSLINQLVATQFDEAEPDNFFYSKTIQPDISHFVCVTPYEPRVFVEGDTCTLQAGSLSLNFETDVVDILAGIATGVPMETEQLRNKYGSKIDSVIATLVESRVCAPVSESQLVNFR